MQKEELQIVQDVGWYTFNGGQADSAIKPGVELGRLIDEAIRVQARFCNAALAQDSDGRVDHRGRAAQIRRRGVAKQFWNVLRHQAGAPFPGLRRVSLGQNRHEPEVRPIAFVGRHLVERVQILLAPRAKQHRHRPLVARALHVLKHREDGRQAAASSHHEDWLLARAHVEVTTGATHGDRLAHVRLVHEMPGHPASRHAAHRETHLAIIARRGRERIAARGIRHRRQRDPGKLAGTIADGLVQLKVDFCDVVGQHLLADDDTIDRGAVDCPLSVQLDLHVAAQTALASQYEPIGNFFLRQQISRFGQLINLAALELAFASSAAADATDGGNIDVLALRRIQQGFIGLDSDGLPVDFSFVRSPSEYETHRSCLLKI